MPRRRNNHWADKKKHKKKKANSSPILSKTVAIASPPTAAGLIDLESRLKEIVHRNKTLLLKKKDRRRNWADKKNYKRKKAESRPTDTIPSDGHTVAIASPPPSIDNRLIDLESQLKEIVHRNKTLLQKKTASKSSKRFAAMKNQLNQRKVLSSQLAISLSLLEIYRRNFGEYALLSVLRTFSPNFHLTLI